MFAGTFIRSLQRKKAVEGGTYRFDDFNIFPSGTAEIRARIPGVVKALNGFREVGSGDRHVIVVLAGAMGGR